jgi:hypothetical protein
MSVTFKTKINLKLMFSEQTILQLVYNSSNFKNYFTLCLKSTKKKKKTRMEHS